jgi:hypothetical protein
MVRTSAIRRRSDRARGQIIPFMAVVIVAILLLGAIPLDGGMGLLLMRQTQGGADAAAEAAVSMLSANCYGRGGSAASADNVRKIITTAVTDNIGNSDAGPPTWTGNYLSDIKRPLNDIKTSDPPALACGVVLTVTSQRHNTLGAVMGFGTLSTHVTSAAELRWKGGVVALAKYGLHTVHGNGLGDLTIDGNAYVDSRGCAGPPSNSDLSQPDALAFSCAPGAPTGGRWVNGSPHGEDIIDSFELAGDAANTFTNHATSSNFRDINITGHIYSVTKRPMDDNFYKNGAIIPPCTTPPVAPHCDNAPGAERYFANYNEEFHFNTQPPSSGGGQEPPRQLPGTLRDPLANLPEPDAAHPEDYCPTGAPYSSLPLTGGTVHLTPGTYLNPVVLGATNPKIPGSSNRNFVFDDCNGYPGIYVFKQGIEICPAAGHTVTNGSGGVMLYSAGPFGGGEQQPGRPGASYSIPGCPGEGKTTPFHDTAGNFCPGSVSGTDTVCFENTDQVLDAGYYGSGTYGITMGGHGTVTLSAPTEGTYRGTLLFQSRACQDLYDVKDPATGECSNYDPSTAVARGTAIGNGANIGLDPFPGLRATQPGNDPNKPVNDPTQPGYDPTKPVTIATYHDDFYKPSPTPDNAADSAAINLTGTIYDAYAPLTGLSGVDATQEAKLACTNDNWSDPVRAPNKPSTHCDLRAPQSGNPWSINQPTPGSSLQPAYIASEPISGSYVADPTCAQVSGADISTLRPLRNECQHQLDRNDLWRVLCSVGTPSTSAGRLQLGQSICADDPLQIPPGQTGGTLLGTNVKINITGAAIVDVFTTAGSATSTIDVQGATEVELMSPP